MKKSKLGKGLETLIGDVGVTSSAKKDDSRLKNLDVSAISPNPRQPRKSFDSEKLDELASSIREHGLLQPIVVQKDNAGKYILIAGERRLRACKKLQWNKVQAIVVDTMENKELLAVALVENLQRDDLNPMERADAYSQLIEQYNLTQNDVAKSVGKSRSSIANSVRLLTLPDLVQGWLSENKLSEGHAKVLLQSADISLINKMAKRVIDEGWSVRSLEENMQGTTGKSISSKTNNGSTSTEGLTPHVLELQGRLTEVLGAKVSIHISKKNKFKGKFVISFNHNDDFESVVNHILQSDKPVQDSQIRSFMT